MHDIIHYYSNIAVLEWIAVFASIAYVVLVSYNNILCWPAAIISTICYSFIFYEFYLWSDSALQLYYLAMALYGWSCWQPKTVDESGASTVIAISSRPLATHLYAIGLLTVISSIVGYLMATHTPTDFPYVDAATTVFAIYATYLVTQKVLENWLYWVVIDFVSIYLYIEKGLLPTAFLFVIFVVIAMFGYVKWRTLYKENIKKI